MLEVLRNAAHVVGVRVGDRDSAPNDHAAFSGGPCITVPSPVDADHPVILPNHLHRTHEVIVPEVWNECLKACSRSAFQKSFSRTAPWAAPLPRHRDWIPMKRLP